MIRKSFAIAINKMKYVKHILDIAREKFNKTQKTVSGFWPLEAQDMHENNVMTKKKTMKYSSFITTPYPCYGNNILNCRGYVFQNLLQPNVWKSFKRLASTSHGLTDTSDEETIFHKFKRRLRMTYPSQFYDDISGKELKKPSRYDTLPVNSTPKKPYNQTWQDYPHKMPKPKKPLALEMAYDEAPQKSERVAKPMVLDTKTLHLKNPGRKSRGAGRNSGNYADDKSLYSITKKTAPLPSFSEMRLQEEKPQPFISQDLNKPKKRPNSY